MQNPRTARNWCWTLHAPHYASTESVLRAFARCDKVRYVVFQEEMCPDTARAHLQGYLELTSPRGMTFVKELIAAPQMHLEVARGSREQARDYCMKEDTRVNGPFEHGSFAAGGQGARNDLEAVKLYIDANPFCTDLDLMENFFTQCSKGMEMFRKYRALKQPKRTEMPKVYVFFGAAGTGKSRLAHEMAPDAYVKPAGKWWDGYNGEEDVICDDFYGPAHMAYADWLRVTDRYRVSVEVKGGMVHLDKVKRIFFTSNMAPQLWYNTEREYSSAAFSRRLFCVKQFLENGEILDKSIPELFDIIVL